MNFTPLPCGCGQGGNDSPVGGGGCENGTTAMVVLCDRVGEDCTPFLRHATHECDGDPGEVTDTTLDGQTPYTVAGEAVDCSQCRTAGSEDPVECDPTPMCARLTGLSGPDQWVMPEGAESMTVSIVCGQITITDCSGEETTLLEGCGTLSWSAPGTACKPGALCSPLVVDIPEGSAVYVNWTEPCRGGQ